MFTVVEIDKTSPFVEKFNPHTPYVFKSILTVGGAYNIDNYWTTIFGADGAFNETDKNITSVVLNNIFDVEQVDNLGDLITQENSFLFDFDTQELYIHFPHNLTPQVTTIATGQGWGYCSDTVRYFRNQLYRPIVLSVPALRDSTDPLQYGIIAFGGGTVTLVNDGSFDEDEKLYGNNIRIKMGKDGDDYNDLVTMFSGYIKDYTTTTQEFIIDVADKRERLQLEYPNETIQVIDKHVDGEGYEYKDQTTPDGYGDVIQVPAYPTDVVGSNITFKWGTLVDSIAQVYVEDDDIIKVAHSNFSTDGTFTLTATQVAKDVDPTKGLKKVFVSGKMRIQTNPADIIVDLNNRLFGVEYNTSNYNTTELEQEKALLADVGLYMDKSKKVYEWIEELQNGTNIGFRYEDTEKRTIRLDLPMRSKILDIQPIDIRNADMPIKRNAELYASSCLVKYSKNWRNDSYKQVENKDYEQQVVDEHRVKKVQSYESLLTSKVDADSKALTVMEDIHKVRPIVTLRIDSSLYPKPRIFDMLTAKVSLIQGSAPITHNYSYVVGDDFVLGDDYVIMGENRGETITDMYKYKENCRDYLGDIAGQVIGINWLPATSEVEIEIRERDL